MSVTAVIGPGLGAASYALDRFLRRRGRTIVLDVHGRVAPLLQEGVHRAASGPSVHWLDLAERRQPIGLFKLGPSPHRARFVHAAVRRIGRLGDGRVPSAVCRSVALEVDRVAASGVATLDLVRRTAARHPEGETVARVIEQSLDFSAVRGLSEGIGVPALQEVVADGGLVWLEARREYFSPLELRVLQVLVEASVADAISTASRLAGHAPLRVMHFYPPRLGRRAVPAWVTESTKHSHHVATFALASADSLPTQAWFEQADEQIAVGPIPEGGLPPDLLVAPVIGPLRAGRAAVSGSTGRLTVKVSPAHEANFHRRMQRSYASRRPTATAQRFDPPRPRRKVGDLFDRLGPAAMRAAFIHLWANGTKQPGVDGQTPAAFRARIDHECAQLARALRTGTYRPSPVRSFRIPKESGGFRNIGVCTVRDRVVQYALIDLLEPVFEPTFSPRSIAFRRGRSALEAIELLRTDVASGLTWFLHADVKSYFDRMDRDRMGRMLANRIADAKLLDLMSRLLEMDRCERGERQGAHRGVPQGAPLSPLLANIYLTPADSVMEQEFEHFVRYADDIVVLTDGEARATAAHQRLQAALRRLDLQLNDEKTDVGPVRNGVTFLGFTVTESGVSIPPERLDRFVEQTRRHLIKLGDPQASFQQRARVAEGWGAAIRGFRAYFGGVDEEAVHEQLAELDARVETVGRQLLPDWALGDPFWLDRERLARRHGRKAVQPSYSRDGALKHERMTPPPKSLAAAQGGRSSDEPVAGVEDAAGRLLVNRSFCFLMEDAEDVVLRKGGKELYRRPLDGIDLLLIFGRRVSISVDLQARLGGRGVPIVLSTISGPPAAIVSPLQTGSANLRAVQATRRGDPDVRSTGREMLAAKVGNQSSVLSYFSKYRRRAAPKMAEGLRARAQRLREIADLIRTLETTGPKWQSKLMGHEGRAAALYWRGVASVLPESCEFDARVKRGASDPVNLALNYVYGMLYSEIWLAVFRSGLDPAFGVVHRSTRSDASLVFDLIEEFRAPFADRLVIAMLGRGFRPQATEDGRLSRRSARLLSKAFRKQWNRKTRHRTGKDTPSNIVRGQADAFARLISDGAAYRPFKMRW